MGPAAAQPVSWAVQAQRTTDRLEVAATGEDRGVLNRVRKIERVMETSVYTLRDGNVSVEKLMSSPSTVLVSV